MHKFLNLCEPNFQVAENYNNWRLTSLLFINIDFLFEIKNKKKSTSIYSSFNKNHNIRMWNKIECINSIKTQNLSFLNFRLLTFSTNLGSFFPFVGRAQVFSNELEMENKSKSYLDLSTKFKVYGKGFIYKIENKKENKKKIMKKNQKCYDH